MALTRAERRRNRLAEAHLDLVDQVARRIADGLPSSFDLDDLRGAGYIGLLEAAARFEPRRGVPFRSYAAVRIRGAIIDSCRRRNYLAATCDPLTGVEKADPAADVEMYARRREAAQVISIAVGMLPKAERAVIAEHYAGETPLCQVADALGMTTGQVSQLHKSALRRMRVQLDAAGLRAA